MTPTLKRCSRCHEHKPLEAFNRHSQTRDGRQTSCRECVREYKREYQRRPDVKEQRREYEREHQPRRLYGVTLDERDAIIAKQGGTCAICPAPATHIDHCVDDRIVRGVLCNNCNVGIGHLRHDATRILAAVSYLEAPPELDSDWPLVTHRGKSAISRALTRAQRDAIHERAQHRCAICSSTRRLHIDHCHTTGRIRGLLCNWCNGALGYLADDIERLRTAASYISAPPVRIVIPERRQRAHHDGLRYGVDDLARELGPGFGDWKLIRSRLRALDVPKVNGRYGWATKRDMMRVAAQVRARYGDEAT